jgi:hypothetical protein
MGTYRLLKMPHAPVVYATEQSRYIWFIMTQFQRLPSFLGLSPDIKRVGLDGTQIALEH